MPSDYNKLSKDSCKGLCFANSLGSSNGFGDKEDDNRGKGTNRFDNSNNSDSNDKLDDGNDSK